MILLSIRLVKIKKTVKPGVKLEKFRVKQVDLITLWYRGSFTSHFNTTNEIDIILIL